MDEESEESEGSLDKSLSLDGDLSDASFEREDATPTEEKKDGEQKTEELMEKEDRLRDATDLLQTSLRKLDKSLEFLMSQASISDQSKGRRVKQISFVEPAEVK